MVEEADNSLQFAFVACRTSLVVSARLAKDKSQEDVVCGSVL